MNNKDETAKAEGSRLPRRVLEGLGLIAVAVTATFLWALFWQDKNCSEPACARHRFSLQIELDSFDQVTPIPFEVSTPEGEVSLKSVLKSGGISVEVHPGQTNLPLAAGSGKLDRADLYEFAKAWRSADAGRDSGVDAKLYAILAPTIVSDSGEDLFGVMFDATDREGFAVAPLEIARRFRDREPDAVPVLQLRTFIHELLHALNRRHSEAAQMPGERLTIEAPTKCISRDTNEFAWALRESPLMALSPSTILFFQSAPSAEILPGRLNSPFLSRGTSPADCRDVRATLVEDPTTSRWEFAIRRLKNLLSLQAAVAASEAPAAAKQADVQLDIQAMTAAYPLGYPVAIRVAAVNRGERTLPLIGRLAPGYGMVRIETRSAPGAPWSVVQPIAWYEPIDDAEAMLQPGARTEQTVSIFFQKDQWTFPEPGTYEIRARLQLGEDIQEVTTDPLSIVVERPRAPRDREALQLLLDEDGQLHNDVGRLLLLGGRVKDADSLARVEQLTRDYPETALGSALQLTRASQLLRRPIDPATGERPLPDIAGAREVLADSCSDSGVAALKLQLLDFQEDTTGSQPAPSMLEPTWAAWDGSVPRRTAPIATYSDADLEVANQTFHFCHNEAALREASVKAARKFARELRRSKPGRVVIVGHADQTGSCRYNNGLAMRRAEAMRALLIEAGVRRSRIQIASLGERRRLDFATGEAADRLNRRVEILLPADSAAKLKPPKDAASARALPACGGAAGE